MTNSGRYHLNIKERPHMAAFLKAMVCLLLSTYLPRQSLAGKAPDPPYDEILVFMNVQSVGSVQIPAAIRNETAWLSVSDVFDFLKIRNVPSSGLDSVSGFLMSPQDRFLIDKSHNCIFYHAKKIELSPDALILTATGLYLRSDYFGQVFGLECKFNFRSLSVILHTTLELPVIREIRQEAMRNNLSRLRGETKPDTNLLAVRSPFRLGMADWAVVATQNGAGTSTAQGAADVQGVQNDVRLNLGLGAELAGGAMNVYLNYDNTIPFAEREQFYQWHYVDNDNRGLRQVTAGKIFTPSISSIYSPVVGVQFTNAPTTYRQSFGTYTLSYYAEADWVVELYVNNELVNYNKIDISGIHTFQVPLVYGNSLVKLRFYSPWGEERSTEQNIQVPYTFLPAREFEYTASAGVVEDSLSSRFSRASFNYGISNRLTAGGGVEYLSSVTTGKSIPFVNASFRPSAALMLNGEYAYGVMSKFIASYHLPSDLQFELNYIRYKEGQMAINNSYKEERRATVSIPIRGKKFTAFSRLSLYQIVLPAFKYAASSKYTTAEWLLSAAFLGVSTNIITYALFNEPLPPYVYTSFSMIYRLPGKIIFMPQIQYAYNKDRLTDTRYEFGKYVNTRGYVNLYYERNFKSQFQSVGLGFRYNFSFSLAGLSVTHGNQGTSLVQSASGGLRYDDRINHLSYSNRSSVGMGGLVIVPYLDLNGNGRRDNDEPKVSGLKVRINGGYVEINTADTTIQVSDLQAYSKYILKLDPSFENIAWRLRIKTIGVTVDPNQFRVIEVPVTVSGEVTGMVYLKKDGDQKAQDRILVSFYRGDSLLTGQAKTESDGSFDFTDLPPGHYTARIDSAQMHKLHMTSFPLSLPFTILPGKNGDIAEGLQFTLQALPE